jgi:proline dehydrogenase
MFHDRYRIAQQAAAWADHNPDVQTAVSCMANHDLPAEVIDLLIRYVELIVNRGPK